MQSLQRKSNAGVPSWGTGFDNLGLPQDGKRTWEWWENRARLPILRPFP